MPLTVDRDDPACWWIRVEGEFNISSAGELKSALLEGLSSTKELQVDLERAEGIDITLLQLLVALSRERAGQGGIVSQVSQAAAAAARDAGFEAFPGLAASGARHC
jgi:anti-anti-sigma regulatory factor